MKSDSIPQTDSIRELAAFWDTHDLTDFDDELEEVSEPVFERRPTIHVALEPQEFEVLAKSARSQGLESTQLVQRWVREHLRAS